MRYPFDGSFVVTSPWGWRPGGFHRGIDFGLPTGTPVISVGDGVVSFAAYESDGGNHLVIRLDNPPDPSALKAGYMHLQGFAVQLGDRVSEGQVVGWSDTTGASVTGPHLHFWMGNNANVGAVDPTPFFSTEPARPAMPLVPDFNHLFAAYQREERRQSCGHGSRLLRQRSQPPREQGGDLVHNSFGPFGVRTQPGAPERLRPGHPACGSRRTRT